MLTGLYPAEKLSLHILRASRKLSLHFRKIFQQGTIGKHWVGLKISFMDEMFGINWFLADNIVESLFYDCEVKIALIANRVFF